MNPSLPTRAEKLKARLLRLQDLSSKVEEATNLERLRAELDRRVAKLVPHLQKQILLQKYQLADPLPAAVVNAARRSQGLLEKFKAEPSAATLKQGTIWPTLMRELDGAAGELSKGVLTAWRRSRKEFFAGDTPTTLRKRLARTAENERALKQYDNLHQRLDVFFATEPVDATTIDEVKHLAQQLEVAAHAFNFDVPEAVKAFLEAVQSVGGAPLDLLTAEVIKWLKANQSFDAYCISAKSRQ
jgi:hypothetical protein